MGELTVHRPGPCQVRLVTCSPRGNALGPPVGALSRSSDSLGTRVPATTAPSGAQWLTPPPRDGAAPLSHRAILGGSAAHKSPMTPNFRATWRSIQSGSSAWTLCYIGGTRSGAGSRLPSATSFSEPAPHFRPGVDSGRRPTAARRLRPSPSNAPCGLEVAWPSDRHSSLQARRATALTRLGPGSARSAFPGY